VEFYESSGSSLGSSRSIQSGTAYDLADIVAKSDIDAQQIKELFRVALGSESKEDFINRVSNSGSVFVGDEDLSAVAEEIFSRACQVKSSGGIPSGYEDDEDDEAMYDDAGYDEDPAGPEEGDFVVNEYKGIFQVGDRWSAPFKDWDQASRVIREKMDRDGFYPDIWLKDDHGGYTLTSTDSVFHVE
jgi:hypothetical protein